MLKQLAPAGAGIPFFEKIIGKLSVIYAVRVKSLEQLIQDFKDESDKINELIQECPEGFIHQPILIKRIAGIEDSSRNWSVSMTIEHLIITMTGMSSIIEALQESKKFDLIVNTANVKPAGLFNNCSLLEVEDKFRTCCELSLNRICRNEPVIKTRLTHKHPWFGEMSDIDWIWLLGTHQAIHRKQIQNIYKAIAKFNPS